ncbi:MAG: insulinase family protein [Acidobacteria bacterium]|nr:insulinase family protein [Acidobacteriota bacterium]MBI3657187.1 insulinase family protein [Acidobacteriota bacterium]
MTIKKEVLKNGLSIVTESMTHVRSVAVGVWIKSGSRHESANENGISHFIEHMLFKGTTTRSAETIATTIDAIGGQLDAFTTREYVGFYAKVLDEYLDRAFGLLGDIVLNPTFPEAEIEKERNVIFEEINMVEDSPQELVHEMFTEHFWKNHPLGRPIAGTKKTVGRFKRTHIAECFSRCYSPENMVIVAAGHIKHQRIASLARRYFGGLAPRQARPQLREPPLPRPHMIKRNKVELEQAHICLGTIAPSATSDDRYPAHVLNNILGGSLSSRLFQNIREKRGLVYSIFSGLGLYSDGGCLTIYAGTRSQTVATVVDLIMEELRKLQRGELTAEEVTRSKDNIKGSLVLGLESTSSRMSNLAQQEIYFGRHLTLDETIRKIEGVTLNAVHEMTNRIFDSKHMGMTIVGNLNGKSMSRRMLKV